MSDKQLLDMASKSAYEMSETLFMPATIIMLISEYPRFLIGKTGLDLLGYYSLYVFAGVVISFLVVMTISWYDSERTYVPYFFTGVAVLPVGIFTLVPESVSKVNVPLSEISGYCLIIWGLYLMYIFNTKQKKA